MNKFLSKLYTFLILLRHPTINSKYRWFLRFYYQAKIKQVKFLFKDYIIRKPFKEISFHGEFQQELINVLPYAYWHFRNRTLKKTVSSNFTKHLYFFSPFHEEKFSKRDWEQNFNTDIPNASHNLFIDKSKWLPPPLKTFYKNDIFIFDKPILIIANRYNTEWSSTEPISFFSIHLLDWMIKSLKTKYQIIYNRPLSNLIIEDNSKTLSLNEIGWLCEKHSEVILLTEYYKNLAGNYSSYNELQLKAYANCNKFISVHGGTATLASYFGGTNIIYSKEGLEHGMNEFINIFPQLSGAKILHASTEELLTEMIFQKFVRE